MTVGTDRYFKTSNPRIHPYVGAAAVAGVEYSLMKGLVLGLEFQPFAYRYDIIQIAPQGFGKYNVGHHNIKIFDMPVLKLGFRF